VTASNVPRVNRSAHRCERGHRLGVILVEQVKIASVVVTFAWPMNQDNCRGGMPAATHKLA
jgi:hypothetical protein